MTLTDDWIETYEADKASGKLGRSIFWKLAVDELPNGVDPNDPRVVAAIEHLRTIHPSA